MPAPATMIAPDSFATPEGELTVQPIDHASLVLRLGPHTIYVDPVGPPSRYHGLPAPTGILITHEHSDHLDIENLEALTRGRPTPIVTVAGTAAKLPQALRANAHVLSAGQQAQLDGFEVEATEAHNTTRERMRYHPVGLGNGYVITMGGKRIYVAGDTEPNESIRRLRDIDIAFIPMNLPYTMVAEQAAELVKAFRPAIVYPFHYTQGPEPEKFVRLMEGFPEVEVRARDWYALSR